MRDEAIIADRYELADKCVGLNSAAFADRCSFLDLDKRPDESSISNTAPIEVDRLHQRDVLAELNIDDSNLPKFRSAHKVCAVTARSSQTVEHVQGSKLLCAHG